MQDLILEDGNGEGKINESSPDFNARVPCRSRKDFKPGEDSAASNIRPWLPLQCLVGLPGTPANP